MRPAAWLAVAALAAWASACAPAPPPAPREFELADVRLSVTVPDGWEALDQGKQKRFRKGEFHIVLQNLGPPGGQVRDFDDIVDWGLTSLDHNPQRREVKSRRPATIDGREAMDVETWQRLDHTNPQRILFVQDKVNVLALYTAGMAFEDTLAAFDTIRASLHFLSSRR